MNKISILIDQHSTLASQQMALDLSQDHGFSTLSSIDSVSDGFVLSFSPKGISLLARDQKRTQVLYVDFVAGALAHRRKFGGGNGQAIAKAVGMSGKFSPSILDATAGMGRDAFVLSSLGASVTLLERSLVVSLLLRDGLARARQSEDSDLLAIVDRMHLLNENSADYLSNDDNFFDVIYLDPMFPARKKSADVKKEMKIFHSLIGEDADADSLLDLAKSKARYRVVVKRPRLAPNLDLQPPSYSLKGKSSRFDIYALKAIPK